MTFTQALAAAARDTEALLGRLLDQGPERLREAMRYAVLGPGKRLRPFFVLETARLAGAGRPGALRTAAALECVHCYSLVHDDLPAMDNDDLRRGQPTAHRAFDEATAILAGDALLTFAFEILAVPETAADAEVRNALVVHLARAAGADGMAGGQAIDLAAEKTGLEGEAAILAMQDMKTGALFRFACEAGAVLGRAPEDTREALVRYGTAIGRAFQIVDDILDVESTSQTLGKTAGKDAAAGKATLVAALGMDRAKSRAAALVEEAVASLAPFGADAACLIEAARTLGSRRR